MFGYTWDKIRGAMLYSEKIGVLGGVSISYKFSYYASLMSIFV